MKLETPKITPDQFITEVRKLTGTPWHHAGRTAGVGVDCVGILVLACQSLGITVEDNVNYTTIDEYDMMETGLKQLADCYMTNENCDWTQTRPGDIVVFRGRMYRGRDVMTHVGVLTEDTTVMIHACNDPSSPYVLEEYIRAGWMRIFDSAWRYKGYI